MINLILTASADCIQDVQAAVNSDLESRRKQLLIANKLILNVANTEFMLIGQNDI